ncbi:MAG: hypothetical protein LBK08_01355 [Treponema sp.]|jgi:hypothetical protein|nr:hypothetical protein [Treponema sp.]
MKDTRGTRENPAVFFMGKRGCPASARIILLALLSVFAGLLQGCATLAEAGGRAADGRAFAEKTTALYESGDGIRLRETAGKNGERFLLLTMKKYPAAAFRAVRDGEGENCRFTALEYLGGSYSGWNEFILELAGQGRFVKDGRGGVLFLEGPLEAVRITSGKIRRNGEHVTGESALAGLANRRERIAALAVWMRKEAAERRIPLSFPGGEAFQRDWKPLLLPEITAKKKRPAAWNTRGTVWTWAEDVRWNTSYTALLFPEELRILRDSGALLRDWEEALEWIRVEYEWDIITGRLSAGIAMKRIR